MSDTFVRGLKDRRSEVTDPAQKEHLRESPWLKPGDCTCRTTEDGGRYYVCIVATCDRQGKACGGYCSECFNRHSENVRFLMQVPEIDYHYLDHQRRWSDETYGPGERRAAVIDHIEKELLEIKETPDGDWSEWIDVIILAFDGASRAAKASGHGVEVVLQGIAAKQAKNEQRVWPDWRTADPNKAIEHDRTHD